LGVSLMLCLATSLNVVSIKKLLKEQFKIGQG
jgi:hypothetical protein